MKLCPYVAICLYFDLSLKVLDREVTAGPISI